MVYTIVVDALASVLLFFFLFLHDIVGLLRGKGEEDGRIYVFT